MDSRHIRNFCIVAHIDHGKSFLASYFDTIEINSTCYAPQPPRNLESWVKRAALEACVLPREG